MITNTFSTQHSNLNLTGAPSGDSNPGFVIHRRTRDGFLPRPHKIFSNWSSGYKLPLICFCECAIMITYLLLIVFHQYLSINFSTDFNKAIDQYFIEGYGFPEPEDMQPNQLGSITSKSKLLDINQTSMRYFDFAEHFPCSMPILSEGELHVTITDGDDEETSVIYVLNIVSRIIDFVNASLSNFQFLSLSMSYNLQDLHEQQNSKYLIITTTTFELDRNTHVIEMDTSHAWHPISVSSLSTIVNYPNIAFSIVNITLSAIAIIITIINIYELYVYSREKASRDFQNAKKLFFSKFDRWMIFSLISHTITITACILYSTSSQMLGVLPFSNVMLGIASMLHSFLMFRYLKQKPSTLIVVNVLFKGGVSILLFFLGCLIIFFGYMVMGVCVFGPFSDVFSTFIESFTSLISVTYGDSIYDMFDSVTSVINLPSIVGFIYMLLWTMFSIVIMFNIMISLFEEALDSVIFHAVNEDTNPETEQGKIIASLPFRSYRNVYK